MATPTGTEAADQLFVRVARGDCEAFAAWYDATASIVFGLVRRVLRDEAQAEEVAQEVFVEAWQHASRYDPHRGTSLAWLVTIAHRRAVDRVRAAARAARREQTQSRREPRPDTAADVAELAIRHDQDRRLHEAVAALPPTQREALCLAYFGGRTHTEIADLLGVPLGTAKTRIRDAVHRLRNNLTPPLTPPAGAQQEDTQHQDRRREGRS